jgi:hypothetical protein
MPTLTLAQRVARKLDATDIIGLTLWGEARSEPVEGLVAVASVIANRVRDPQGRFGKTWQEVCLKPWQFSCWIPEGGRVNYERMKLKAEQMMATRAWPDPKETRLRECLWVARGIIDQMIRDNTRGANHYHTTVLDPPTWADPRKITVRIGAHVFYAL